MPDHTIDLKALLVERQDCDAGTIQQLRNGLAQGGTQYRTLRDVTDVLKKKLESAAPGAAKVWHLKIGIASFFLGYTRQAVEHLRHADTALAGFYLGRALVSLSEYDEALRALERSEKLGYNAELVDLQRAGILRLKGDVSGSRKLLEEPRMRKLASYNAEYHFQVASCYLSEGERLRAVEGLEQAVKLDPGHTGALFQLGHANDLAGNDDEAIRCYERCLQHPPVHVGVLINLGVLYEDHEKYREAVDCYRRVLSANPTDEEARLFFKDAEQALTMKYDPEEEVANRSLGQVLEIPVTDFELSVRSRNCLKKMNIRTLGDLTRVTREQLLSSKNFGETSLKEIEDMLGTKGLHLGQSIEEGAQNEMRYRPAQPVSEEQQAVLNKAVSELNLSVRARKCMNRLGINTLGELVQRTAEELLESKNFGQTSLNEVREKLSTYGLTLRGE
jgi:DNA-directed RNA polymerase subunit alpha